MMRSRLALDAQVRRARGESAIARLFEVVDISRYLTLGIYWPIRCEIDVREIARMHVDAGGRVALPVVVRKSAPLEFWRWRPGMQMQKGVWNVPIPCEREEMAPDALIVPLVGFDGSGFRLGYGGGYYDRTLAAAVPRPYAIGLGYAEAELKTIYPQPHDIPMNLIVTDQFVHRIGTD
jgi:5,10-methenyltetrahydrofolate synthetase